MRVCLDVCCGKGGVTQSFREHDDWQVIGIDSEKKFFQHWQGKNLSFIRADIRTVDWHELKEQLPKIDLLWASPPCTHFSLANLTFPREGVQEALEIVGSCFEAVAILKPRFYMIENPRARLRHFLPKPSMTIFYSDWDKAYPCQKPTDLWSNFSLLMAPMKRRPSYGKGIKVHEDRHHLWGKILKGNAATRAMVPKGVSNAVLEVVERRLDEEIKP